GVFLRIPPFPPRSLSPAAKSLMCRVGEHGVELTADHQIKPFAPHRSSPESPTVPFAPLPLHPAEECFGASSAPNEAFGFRRFPDAFWGDEANTFHPTRFPPKAITSERSPTAHWTITNPLSFSHKKYRRSREPTLGQIRKQFSPPSAFPCR